MAPAPSIAVTSLLACAAASSGVATMWTAEELAGPGVVRGGSGTEWNSRVPLQHSRHSKW